MTASQNLADRSTATSSRRLIRRILAASGRSFLYCLLLLPLAVAAVVATLVGQAPTAIAWWRWLRSRVLRVPPAPVSRRRAALAVTGHALGQPPAGRGGYGAVGMEGLFITRSVLYGLVDSGPYTESWGGPTLAGAWLAHFLVGIPLAGAGLLALAGIAAIHQRLSRALDAERVAAWLIPVALIICLLGGLFFVAWLQQLPS